MMNPTPSHSRRAAFTLIEILVTISIIVLLVGISIPVALKMLATAEASQTRTTLNGLEAAATEYNVVTGGTVPHFGKDAFGNDVDLSVGEPEPNTGGGTDVTFGYFVLTAGQVPTAAQLISLAVKDNLTAPDGKAVADLVEAIGNGRITNANYANVQLLDGWDNQIRYADAVSHNDSFDEDDYLPAHPTPFFASAGPDGLWGSVIKDTNEPDPDVDEDDDGVADSADNIYSFDQDGLQ